jgi:hypothetical protein
MSADQKAFDRYMAERASRTPPPSVARCGCGALLVNGAFCERGHVV